MRSVHILFLTVFLVSGTIRAGSSTDLEQSKASPEDGQPTSVEVGDAKLTGSQLRPYTNLWTMSQQKPGGRSEEVGTWSDSLESSNYEGRSAMKRTQIAKYDKKGIQLTFVSIFDPKTMAPFSFDYLRSDNGNIRHVEFRQKNVTYRHTDSSDSKPEEATAKLDRQVFDFYGGMYGMLISTLPLTEGYTATIPALDTNTMAIDWVPVQVKGRGTVDAGAGKKAETWVVETPTKLYGRMTWVGEERTTVCDQGCPGSPRKRGRFGKSGRDHYLHDGVSGMLTKKSWIVSGITGLMILPLFQSAVAGQIQEREQIVEHSTFYRTAKIDGLSIFIAKPDRKMGHRFCCCTDFLLRRGCLSRSLHAFPIVIT